MTFICSFIQPKGKFPCVWNPPGRMLLQFNKIPKLLYFTTHFPQALNVSRKLLRLSLTNTSVLRDTTVWRVSRLPALLAHTWGKHVLLRISSRFIVFLIISIAGPCKPNLLYRFYCKPSVINPLSPIYHHDSPHLPP